MEILRFEEYSILVRRRAYRRTMSLTVEPSGQVVVGTGKNVSQRVILQFVRARLDWLDKAQRQYRTLREKYPAKRFVDGEAFPYLGVDYTLKILSGDSLGLRFVGGQIVFSRPPSVEDGICIDLLKRSYRRAGEKLIGQRIAYYAEVMQLFPRKVSFRGQKSIWGSCSPENHLSMNWKLIVAPLNVIDYVAIHELAHIREKNHSARFWKIVEAYTSDRHYSRHWLRENYYQCDFLNKQSELWK